MDSGELDPKCLPAPSRSPPDGELTHACGGSERHERKGSEREKSISKGFSWLLVRADGWFLSHPPVLWVGGVDWVDQRTTYPSRGADFECGGVQIKAVAEHNLSVVFFFFLSFFLSLGRCWVRSKWADSTESIIAVVEIDFFCFVSSFFCDVNGMAPCRGEGLWRYDHQGGTLVGGLTLGSFHFERILTKE